MSDRTRVTLRVAASRELAFQVFTEGIDRWWRHGRRFRMAEPSVMTLEPRVGGLLTETALSAPGRRVWTLGEVITWEPPRRLVIGYRPVNFAPDDPSTEVEVCFERAIGHSGEGTLVTLEHRGWSRVRADHPVRHGQDATAFIGTMGTWWGALLGSLREHLAQLGP